VATGAVRRCYCALDNHRPFPEFCIASEKRFRRTQELFRRRGRKKQFYKKSHDFNEMHLNPQRIVHWPSRNWFIGSAPP
jgi:hypothetical protein